MRLAIEITGKAPLLMNRFRLEELEKKPKNKNLTPMEEAKLKAYEDEKGRIYYPKQNLLACITEAGKFHKDGKVKITTLRSSLISSAVSFEIEKSDRLFFKRPKEWVIDTRAVVVPSTGGRVVCHRAKLEDWCLPFELVLDTNMFSTKLIRAIIDDAGTKIGLGDFRVSRKGWFGKFVVSDWKEV